MSATDPDYHLNDPFAMLPGSVKKGLEEHLTNMSNLYNQDAS